MLTPRQLLALWTIARSRLIAAKKLESSLRIEVVNSFFYGHVIGTSYKPDVGLTLVAKLNYNLSNDVAKVGAALEQISEVYPDINLGDLVKWRSELNEKEYAALPEPARDMLADVLTIKPAMPVLTLAAEKETDT